ncbi:MAG: hypothetical protein HOM55_09335 [Proteobacteria bacterium]|nr:hypothetical protein [Pseudomonadota bacterium]
MSTTYGSMFSRASYIALASLATLVIAGCSSAPSNPVLYPNNTYVNAGRVQADADIEQCMQMATNQGVKTTADGKILEQSASGAAVAGASAGAWGIVRGDFGERLLAGAAAGAAGGAVNGMIHSNRTNPVFKNFTTRCLRNKGYEVIGWQ